jgi:hypothetical protein
MAEQMTSPTGAADETAWLHAVLRTIARRWWLLPLTMLAALLLGSIYLHRADYSYTAELKVYAAPSTSGSRPASALGGLAALAGIGGGTSEAVSPFRFYLDGIYSTEVAARLARDRKLMHLIFPGEWDARARTWRQPAGLGASVKSAFASLFGLPQFGWHAPDAGRLQAYIADNVTIRQSAKTPIAILAYDSADPKFATLFLNRINDTTDNYLREQQTARTRGNIAYLTQKLTEATLAEQRQALVTTLSEQERQAMLAYGNAPYAAEPFDLATASAEPTRPRAIPLLIGVGVAGLIIGIVLALWFGRRRAAVPVDG